MAAPDLPSDTAELVEHLRSVYGLPDADARLIVSDPEFAAMARWFVEGKLASDAAFQRWDEAIRRFRKALAESASRR